LDVEITSLLLSSIDELLLVSLLFLAAAVVLILLSSVVSVLDRLAGGVDDMMNDYTAEL